MLTRSFDELMLHIDLVNNGVEGTGVVTYYDPVEYTAGRNPFNKKIAHNHIVRINGERYEVRLDREHKYKDTINLIYVPGGKSYKLPGKDTNYLDNAIAAFFTAIVMAFLFRKLSPNQSFKRDGSLRSTVP